MTRHFYWFDQILFEYLVFEILHFRISESLLLLYLKFYSLVLLKLVCCKKSEPINFFWFKEKRTNTRVKHFNEWSNAYLNLYDIWLTYNDCQFLWKEDQCYCWISLKYCILVTHNFQAKIFISSLKPGL